MLTVEEIVNVSFRRAGLSGYKIEDVDDFVDGVIDKVKEMQLTNRELQARVEQLNEKVMRYEQQASSVQEAIITADLAAKRITHDAEIQAEAMLNDAKVKADSMLRDAEEASSQKMLDSELRAQTILDNALSRSASSIDENNRIIEQQKQHIIQIQSEVTRFREALIDSYKNHLRIINSLPKEEEFRQYQANLDAAYPMETPVTSDMLGQEIMDDADRAVEQAKAESPQITVSVLDADKVKEIAEEMRNSSKVQAELESAQEAERRIHEMADVNVSEEPAGNAADENNADNNDENDDTVILFKQVRPDLVEQPDSNADEIMAAANAAAEKHDQEPMPTSIDEIGNGLIFGTDESAAENSDSKPADADEGSKNS